MDLNLIKEVISCISGVEFCFFKKSDKNIFDYLNQKSGNLLGKVLNNPNEISRIFSLEKDCIYEVGGLFGTTIMFFYNKKTLYM